MENTHQIKNSSSSSSSMDRLSALPDEVICHILSFLPTKISISTSILARRWRFLWAHVPNLHFDPEVSIDTIYNKVLLLYRVKNLNVLRLHSNGAINSLPQLEACIDEAIDRNVRKIDLSFGLSPSCFPSRILSCTTVVEMELSCLGRMDNFYLPALKKLHICWVLNESFLSLSCLLSSGCPVLEELTLERLCPGVDSLVVSSSTINRLVIGSAFVGCSDNRFRLKIDAPEVRYLKVRDFVSKEISAAGPLASLIGADVNLDKSMLSDGSEEDTDDDSDDDSEDDSIDDADDDIAFNNEPRKDVAYSRSALEFVRRLSNVKSLKLSTSWMDVSDSQFLNWSVKFQNLTNLELGGDWRFIPTFLENAENLESLVICAVNTFLKQWIEPTEVPACLLSHLRIVRICNFECADQEFSIIEYILRNAKVLKRIEIHFLGYVIDPEDIYEAINTISLFPVGSEECEFSFS